MRFLLASGVAAASATGFAWWVGLSIIEGTALFLAMVVVADIITNRLAGKL